MINDVQEQGSPSCSRARLYISTENLVNSTLPSPLLLIVQSCQLFIVLCLFRDAGPGVVNQSISMLILMHSADSVSHVASTIDQ